MAEGRGQMTEDDSQKNDAGWQKISKLGIRDGIQLLSPKMIVII